MSDILPKPRVYSYLRFSTPEQALGDSARRQIEAARKWAREHDLVLDEELRDEGVSGFRGANLRAVAGLGSFLRAVESGDVPPGSTLIVESLDRLSRDRLLAANTMLSQLLLNDIRIVTLSDQREFTQESVDKNPTDLLLSLLIFMRSNEESETKSKRLRAVWSNKRRQATQNGTPLTSVCPSWLRVEGNRFVVIEERAEIVRRVFMDTVDGKGQHAIAQQLTSDGVPTWRRGKVWHRTYIKKLLANPAVIGRGELYVSERLQGGGIKRTLSETVEDYFPRIVDDELWGRVSIIIGDKKAARGRHAGKAVRHLLANLAKCPICDGTMTRVNKGVGYGRTYLVCAQAKAKGRCFYKQVPIEKVDAAIFEGFPHLLDRPASNPAEKHLMALIEGQNVQLGQIREELDDLRRLRRDRKFTTTAARREQELYEMNDSAEALLKKYGNELEVIASSVVDSRMWRMADLLTAGPQDDLTAANMALKEAFTGVVVDYETGHLRFQWRNGGETNLPYDLSIIFGSDD